MSKSRAIRSTKTIISGIGIVGLGVFAKLFNVHSRPGTGQLPGEAEMGKPGENCFTLLEHHITFAGVVGILGAAARYWLKERDILKRGALNGHGSI